MKSEMESQSSKLMSQSGVVALGEVATVNEITVNPKSFDWLNYTDISSVGIRTVDAPQMMMGENAPSRARRVLRDGDTVLSTVRPNRKSYFQFKDDWERAIASTGFAVISPKSLQDADYLYAVLTSEAATLHYESLCEGGAYPAFNPRAIEEMQIPWPSSEERNVIGGLSAEILKKIQTNFHLAGILEEIAQAIFKSWFVDFEPVKAKMAGEKPVGMDDETAALFPDSMEESELGSIPKGWKVQSLSDIGEFRNGLAMQKFPVVDEDYVLPVIKIAQLRAGNTNGADIASGLIDPKFVISDGDILFSWSGTLEIEHWAGGQGALNQHLFKVLGKTVPDWFVYYSSRNHLPEFRRIASGKATTMGHIQRGHLAEAKVAVPPVELLTAIGELLSSLVSQKVALVVQNRALAELRDALLPRLISGELQIPEEMLVL